MSAQGPALGSAIHAAVAAGGYPDIHAASAAMGRSEEAAYMPGRARARRLRRASTPSTSACTTTSAAGANDVMHRLRRNQAEGGDAA